MNFPFGCELALIAAVDRHSLAQFPASSERVTEVKTDIFVTSFGPVSDHDMVSDTTHLISWFCLEF